MFDTTVTIRNANLERPADGNLEMLQQVATQCPQVAIAAVGSVEDAETLSGLAWDLGADYALFPPLSRDLLADVVRGLMLRTIKKQSPPVAAGGLRSESEPSRLQ